MIRGLRAPAWVLVVAVALAVGCRTGAQVGDSGTVREAANLARYDPSRDLWTLFHDVQVAGLFPDSKTFADARPVLSPTEIVSRYALSRDSVGFSLQDFVDRHFELPQPVGEGFQADTSRTMEEHIRALWPVLTRAADTPDAHSSLIPLPHPYVVPGGRFREVYYWDSYFTMLGLVESDRTDLVRSMLDNFAHLTRTVGHVPNGNRTYYLSRSQPPFLAAMVGLYAEATDTTRALPYLDALEAEHGFWMDGAEGLKPGEAYRRVVRLSDGSVLNRYWDDRPEPRPESYREDHELGGTLPEARRAAFYRDVRAAAESGWDFSSRWMRDPSDLRTLETTELVPVDLNSLLYQAERTIAALRAFRGHPGDAEIAERLALSAERRRRALVEAAYEPDSGFFYDVRWRSSERVIDRPTMAAAAVLYFGLATPQQGRAVAARLERDFLERGGFVTTLVASGQQWDAPNGWPPLQWMGIQGVGRFGRADLAEVARDRWLELNRRTYRATGRMMEKYDVVDLGRRAGGGEYPTQDGFGWTNGVALALLAERGSDAVGEPGWSRRRGLEGLTRTEIIPKLHGLGRTRLTHPSIRGRGAAHNPPNRFDLISVEREAWTHAKDPAPETAFYRDASRSIIATNDSPDVGFDASVNPYRGCEHGCTYCADGETPVLMADGTTRRLAELIVGDEIYGTTRRGFFRSYERTVVLAHWKTTKPAYRVTLEDSTELVASGDHRFLTLRGWKFVTGTEQGRMRRPHLTTNDSLLGVGGFAVASASSSDYRRGYLCGMIRGDGHLATHEYRRSNGRMGRLHQFRLALVDESGLDRTAGYLRGFGVETGRFLFQRHATTRREMQGIRAQRRADVDRIVEIVSYPDLASRDWSRGFMAGIFDAEGSYSAGILRISNADPVIIDVVSRSLRCFGFDVVLEPVTRGRSRPITYVRLRGGLKEHLRFFHTVDPAIFRKRNIEGQALKSQANLRVVSIEPIGERTLFDITTGTGDFIANGVVSHNCYARPTHEYFGLSAGIDWETKIFVKEDAPTLLRRQLSSPKWEPKPLAMSGVTDPYQPVERRLGITRRCLEVLAEFRNPVVIITKNHLVTRDIDLLQRLALHNAAIVNLSITTLRRSLQQVMEPRTSIPEKRLEAIRRLSGAGIPTGVLVAPVIPGLTDHEMPKILERAAEAGAVRAGWVMLRLPHAVKDVFEDWLGRHFPDRKAKVLNRLLSLRGGRLNDPRFGSRMRGEGPFAEQISQVFAVSCRRYGLNRSPVQLSTAAFRRPTVKAPSARVEGSQLPLL